MTSSASLPIFQIRLHRGKKWMKRIFIILHSQSLNRRAFAVAGKDTDLSIDRF